MKNRTCKYCGNELNGQPEFCDGICTENYAEQKEENEYKEIMRS